MATGSAFTGRLHLRSSLFSPRAPRPPRKNLLVWKRRRLKLLARLGPAPVLLLPFDHIFNSLLSAFPSANSLDLIIPALSFAYGAAFYFSARDGTGVPRKELGETSGAAVDPDGTVVGEWVLVSSPTPFNRSVLVRCPSAPFEGSEELAETVKDWFVREEGQYVNVSRGVILADQGREEAVDDLSYQRLCVAADDGAVISLDWPANLELGKEEMLDTTVLLVPGTSEGSMARNVRAFVLEALRHGYFPIVMNPRGCAGSPLTTPRLFSAADSDDVCNAIRFVNKSRPWATLMSVAWGYGANMLTKYLTEVEERTPLTAAVCIDNPFDLNEATKSLLNRNEMDKKLTSGLVEILQSNKELFQGKRRGFNVAKALSAATVRDFDEAISMISHGFKSIDDFYAKSSTKQLVDRVKIPLLFIQSDNSMAPLSSVPRTAITENPFTSLLICSFSPSSSVTIERSTITWCHNIAIEWLSAVEIALLKGRHPLLSDVDVAITPIKSIPILNGSLSEKDIRNKLDSVCEYESDMQTKSNGYFLSLPTSNIASGYLIDPISTLLEKNHCAYRENGNDDEAHELGTTKDDRPFQEDPIVSASSRTEQGNSLPESEKSQALATATIILNMLDVTMPGALDYEQKKKVLTATEQGETFMKALQGAVPDDVRGKLLSAVSEIVQSQGNKLNVKKLKMVGWIPNVTSSTNSKIHEQSGDVSSTDCKKNDENRQLKVDGDIDGEFNVQDRREISREKYSEASGQAESKLEALGKPNPSDDPEMTRETNPIYREDGRHENGHTILIDSEPHLSDGKKVDECTEDKIVSSSINQEKTIVPDSSAVEVGRLQKEANDMQGNSSENVQISKKTEPCSNQLSTDTPPSISVSQALDALTGIDDSTQMAINSVFEVIENMIDHLERETSKNDSEERKDCILDSDNASRESLAIDDQKVNSVSENNASNPELGHMQTGTPQANFLGKLDTPENVMKQDDKNYVHGVHSSHSIDFGKLPRTNVRYDNLTQIQRPMPLNLRMNQYWDFSYSYKGYLQKYISQMPNIEQLDTESATDLFLDQKEGRWKMLDQMEGSNSSDDIEDDKAVNDDQMIGSTWPELDTEDIVEPLYSIPDMEMSDLQFDSGRKMPIENNKHDGKEELGVLIKHRVLRTLMFEIERRIGMPDLKVMESHIMPDLEQVADSVSCAIICDGELSLGKMKSSYGKFGRIHGYQITRTISHAVHNSSHLRKILPVGVIVGSILASLRKDFVVTAFHEDRQVDIETVRPTNVRDNHAVKECDVCIRNHFLGKDENQVFADNSSYEDPRTAESSSPSNENTMVGAVTATLGASALLAHHQSNRTKESNDLTEVRSHIKNEGSLDLDHKSEQTVQEKTENSLVSTLAEKAMSVAGPVVPMKGDGEVDHERLVATLAELGQKGGVLRLIGKVALLWGGIRGAMSLTDRLISFLRISERPLFQRILGFACMVLVMWSPVVIPLLPTLVGNWTLKGSRGIADYACVIGLYAAITILVVLWGRRIRGYENPLKQYGLDLASTSKVRLFMKGFIGGAMLVLYVHSVNALLGYASLGKPSFLPSNSNHIVMMLKIYGLMLVKILRGVTIATFIAMVEELLFRSWLPEEIAADLGYHQSIIISGILFSLLQRSLASLPAFLFLSLALFGAKQKGGGTLFLPIGIRTGMITTNFVVQTGGFLYYKSATPFWLASVHPSRPFDGIVGLSISILMATLLFPRGSTPEKGNPRGS